MTRHAGRAGLLMLALAATSGPRRAAGQAALADDIIVLSKGARGQERERDSALGSAPGAGASPFRTAPGAAGAHVKERVEPRGPTVRAQAPRRGLLSAAEETEGEVNPPARPRGIVPPARLPPTEVPLYGPLDLPEADDAGAPDGLTLERAIDRLLLANHDLRAKFQELPQARADILNAGLRANPILFASADSVPYGHYSPQKPNSNDYTFVIVQPFDVNGKRRARLIVAHQARRVLEAQYQDAVRLEIDNLATAFVDVLEARETLRFARASLAGIDKVLETTRQLFRRGDQPRSEVERFEIQHETATIGIEQAEGALGQARQALAALLDLPDAEAGRLEVRGALRVEAPPPPPVEALIRIAQCNRPDLAAFRLGVGRAEAGIRLAQAERFEDVFVLYTPYTYTNNAPLGERSAMSWSVGGVVSVPLFNRNQGNIARARGNVIQSRIELAGLERQVVAEVRRALVDYDVTRSAVERLDRLVLPKARRLRDESARLFARGAEDAIAYINAQRDFNEVVRQYRDALTHHRRAMLRLNTAVGLRIFP